MRPFFRKKEIDRPKSERFIGRIASRGIRRGLPDVGVKKRWSEENV
jgi:hypothetical protein